MTMMVTTTTMMLTVMAIMLMPMKMLIPIGGNRKRFLSESTQR